MAGPVVIHPHLLRVTVIHVMSRGQGQAPCSLGSATGFFFHYDARRFLVTNRHVIINEQENFYPDQVVLRVHTSRTSMIENREIEVPLYDTERRPVWLEHATRGIDLAAIEIGRLVRDSDAIEYWSPDLFAPNNLMLGPGADCLVVGYPMGLYDTMHNLPIIRSGTLATQFGAKFEGDPVFLVDANLHHGTSGSPVITPPFQHSTINLRRRRDGKLSTIPARSEFWRTY